MIEIQTFVLMFEFRVLFRTFIFIFWRDGVWADIIKKVDTKNHSTQILG